MHWLSKKINLTLMLLPTLLIYSVFIIFSVGIAVYYSFTKYSGIGKAKWLGLDNYVRLFKDRYFWTAFGNSMIILLVSLVLLTVFGFLLANLFRMKLRFNAVAKASIFSPAIIAPIIVGIIWLFILDPEIGAVNALLRALGKPNWAREWIGGETLSPYAFAVVFVWRQLGYFSTIFLAGLNLIPADVYESAAIDGGSAWQRMRYITIPMMKQTFMITTLLAITESFKIFEIVLQLTNGGPNHLSEVLVTYTYTTTFKGGEYGYGMSLAAITFLITLIFSFAYSLITSRKEAKA